MFTYVDKRKCKIGFVTALIEGEGRTGYQIQMLIRDKEYIYDVDKDVYDELDAGRYGQYPSIVEFLYVPIFDETGIVKQLMVADTFGDADGILKSHIEFGTYAMFKYKITKDTLKVGDFFEVEENAITFKNFDKNKEKLKYLEYGGAIPAPKDDMSLELADDTVVYIWDWRQAKAPFNITCSREECIKNNFVTRFEVGTLDDIKEGHWIDMISTSGNEKVIDTIVCFINKEPGWTFK